MSEEIEVLKKERDELAARCERLTTAIDAYRTAVESGFSPSGDEIDDLDSAIQEPPAASLAHVRAEAIESAVNKHSGADRSEIGWTVDPGDRMEEADAIRRSASQAVSSPEITDEQGRPMTYWGGKASQPGGEE